MNNGYTNIAYRGQISQGTLSWNLYMNGTASNYLAGQLLIGTTSKGTFALDVNGTARVSDNLTVSRNQNAFTGLLISNTTSGTASYLTVRLTSDAGSGEASIGKNSTLANPFKTLLGKDFVLYNNTIGGDISILNDFAAGSIKFATGGSSTAQMTLHSNGNLTARSTLPSTLGASSFNFFVGLSGLLNASATINDVGLNNNGYFDGTNSIYKNNGFATNLYFDSSGNIRFFNAPSGTAGNVITYTERISIKANGSVRYIPMATPSSAEAGDVYYDSSTNKLRCYNGTSWNDLF
jgi:hypothetical protein